MADWFKVYETDLDDKDLEWAVSEQPCTSIVYIHILVECCKQKSATIKWGEDFQLLALARKINFGVGLVNDAIQLLNRIHLITVGNQCITANKWADVQSDYCRKKDNSPEKSDKVRQSPEKSLRGEERRGENKKEGFSGSELVIKNQELDRAMKRLDVIRYQYEAHQTWSPSDVNEKKKLKARIEVLKAALGVEV